jgi:hypothetical protein
MRELVRYLDDFFTVLGYKTVPQEHRLTVEDMALLSSSEQVIVAGQARSIRDEEITFQPPRFVVVEDGAPDAEISRLVAACKTCKTEPSVLNFSRFVDPLWQAAQATNTAQRDAQAAADLDIATGLADSERPNPGELYVDPLVQLESDPSRPQSVLRATEDWLTRGEGTIVVLAPAGLGKSELAGILEWRAALVYLTRSSRESFQELPPVAMRVPLRELRSLSLVGIADYLRTARGLDRLRNAEVLTQLLLHRRLVLLLDGLDEFAASRSLMEEGLAELSFVAAQGARIMLTSRSGYYASESSIRAKLGSESILLLEPLDQERGMEMLRKRGASPEEAKSAAEALPLELRGIPLFLIWAWRSRFRGGVDEEPSEAKILLHLVQLFCLRDEPRIKVSADKQIEVLTDLAYHSAFHGAVSKTDFAFLVGADDSPFVEGPHALLRVNDSEQVDFRDATFASLFLAQGILKQWRDKAGRGGQHLKEWLGERLGAAKLDSLALDYLAELTQATDLQSAWTLASEAPVRYQPFTRRNLLGVALAGIRTHAEGRSPSERSKLLEQALGGRDLSDTALADLVLEMYDFREWDLRRCDGRGAYIAFCGFESAQFDAGLQAADIVSSTGLVPRVSEDEVMRKGLRRLTRALGPWRNHALGPDALRSRLGEDTRGLDMVAMKCIRAHRLAELAQAERGLRYWQLTDGGKRLFRETLSNPAVTNPELRELLLELGRLS